MSGYERENRNVTETDIIHSFCFWSTFSLHCQQ